MNTARYLKNDEIGQYFPVRELLNKQASEARKLAGEFLVQQWATGGSLAGRPVVVGLEDGTITVQDYAIDPSIFDN